MKPTESWLKHADIYKRFASGYKQADFDDEAARIMFEYESGLSDVAPGEWNGYALGKKWMNVTVASWIEDIKCGSLTKSELISDGFPEWFIEENLSGIFPDHEGNVYLYDRYKHEHAKISMVKG